MTLTEYLDKKRSEAKQLGTSYTQSDLARHLGVKRQTVHGWLSGKWTPSDAHKCQIQQATLGEVTESDWPCSHCT